jgi:hypothetical protein
MGEGWMWRWRRRRWWSVGRSATAEAYECGEE